MTTSRRSFLRSILVAGASFSILPGAGRVWKAIRTGPPFIVSEWIHPVDAFLKQSEDEFYRRKFLEAFLHNAPIQGLPSFQDLPTIEVDGRGSEDLFVAPLSANLR